MSLRSILTWATALAVAAIPAVPSGASPEPRHQLPDAAQADTLTIFSDFEDHAVIEVVDLATGRREVTVERGHRPHRDHDDTGETGETGDTGGVHQDADDAVSQDAVSTSARCSNSGTWNYVPWGSWGRTRRPWRMSVPIHFNPSGAPVSFNWRAEMLAGSNIWQNTVNPCGIGDRIGWVTPSVAGNTSAPACRIDGVNTHGWKNFGGWETGGLLLARTCLSSNSALGTIVEADIAYNNHSDAVWCRGACTSGWDLRSVAAHEWGHYLGLGHVCNDNDLNNPCNTAAEEGAVMYPWINANETQNRSLSRGDIDGASNLYPHEWGYEIVDVTLDNPAGADQPLTPGRTYDATARVRNTGMRHWQVGGPVELRTADSTSSDYAGPDWLSPSRASSVDADLTNDLHPKLPNDETTVITGEEAEFAFTVTVPFAKEPASGTLDDLQSFRVGGAAFTTTGTTGLDLPVGSIALEIAAMTGPGTPTAGFPGVVVQGAQTDAALTVRNTGTAPWFPADGTLQLVTDPEGNCSPFEGDDWATCEVVTPLDASSIVPAGDEADFAFRMSSPVDPSLLGPQSETFVAEWLGRPANRFGPTATFSFVVL